MSDRKRRYVVTGIHPVLGHKPGTEFTATLPEVQEAALLAGRGLAVVQDKRPDDGGKNDESKGKTS